MRKGREGTGDGAGDVALDEVVAHEGLEVLPALLDPLQLGLALQLIAAPLRRHEPLVAVLPVQHVQLLH